MHWSDVCTGTNVCTVRRLYQSDVCTKSDVCTSPTIVAVRPLYCPTFDSLLFVPSDVSGSDVCTGTLFYWTQRIELSPNLTFVWHIFTLLRNRARRGKLEWGGGILEFWEGIDEKCQIKGKPLYIYKEGIHNSPKHKQTIKYF